MWIKEYILTIASVVLLSALAEALMPDSKMKKHISLVTGLVMLLAIAKPVVSLPRFSLDDIFFSIEDEMSASGYQISKSIEEAQLKDVNAGFENALSESISSSIAELYNVKCKVKVVSEDGEIKQIKLYCNENEKIKKHINEYYGLNCVFTGDGGKND